MLTTARVMCNVPQTFKESMSSSKSEMWASVMKEEIDSLRENYAFTLTTLPDGKMQRGIDGSIRLNIQ